MPTSAHVPLGDSASLASYGVYHQYLHQARYGTMGLPIDFFYPADAALPPEYAHAFSLALRRGLGHIDRLLRPCQVSA